MVEDLTVGIWGAYRPRGHRLFRAGGRDPRRFSDPAGAENRPSSRPWSAFCLPGGERFASQGRRSGRLQEDEALSRTVSQVGVLFQSGALIDLLTVAENVALPLREFTGLPGELIDAW